MTRVARAVAIVVLVGVVASAGVVAGQQSGRPVAPADLEIVQPHYVDADVGAQTGPNATTYDITGEFFRIYPQNFNNSQVIDFGVDGPGTLEYNAERDYYEFTPEANGTVVAYWVVRETQTVVRNNSTTTQTRSVRYQARLQAEKIDLVHQQRSEVEQLRADAANWTETVNSIQRAAGEDANIEVQLQAGINWIRVTNNPTKAFTGELGRTIQILALSLSGIFLVALTLTIHTILRWSDIRYRNTEEMIKAERGDAEDIVEDLELQERKQTLASWRWADLDGLPDPVAREFREELGDPLEGILDIYDRVSPMALLHDRLAAMGHDGYVGVAHHDEVATDGGEDEGDDGDPFTSAVITGVEIVPENRAPDADAAGVDVVDLTDLDGPRDQFLRALDASDPDLWDDRIESFDLPSAPVDRPTPAELEAPNIEEVTDRYIDQWERLNERREVYADFLLEWLTQADRHPIVEGDGRVNTPLLARDVLIRLDRILDEEYDMPFAGPLHEHLEFAFKQHDSAAETEQFLDDVESGRFAGKRPGEGGATGD
jgi:hypothetical protein